MSARGVLNWGSDFAEAHYDLGLGLQQLGKLEEAVASYRRALDLKPDFAKARYGLGSVYLDLGQHKEGLKCEQEGHGVIEFSSNTKTQEFTFLGGFLRDKNDD